MLFQLLHHLYVFLIFYFYVLCYSIEKEPPSTLMWILFLLAQVSVYQFDDYFTIAFLVILFLRNIAYAHDILHSAL